MRVAIGIMVFFLGVLFDEIMEDVPAFISATLIVMAWSFLWVDYVLKTKKEK